MTDRPGGPSPEPLVTVVMATRDRPKRAVESVTLVLESDHPDFGLVVVDQSSTGKTREALAHLEGDPRLRVIPSPPIGLAAARNLGVRSSASGLLAFTDDDCHVAPDWISALVRAFESHPGVGLVFGSVRAPDYDRGSGFIVAYEPSRTRVVTDLRGKARIEGIGGCMAVNRSAWERLGGFDELLGAGAPLVAGEETDLAVRALLAGIAVCETPEPSVVHTGFHRWDDAPRVIAGYMFGLGAVYTKMVRLGGLRALKPLRDLAWRWVAGSPAADLNHVPPRAVRLRQFARGGWAAVRLGLDPETGHFVRPAPSRDPSE